MRVDDLGLLKNSDEGDHYEKYNSKVTRVSGGHLITILWM
jgi:hypothetical protein